LPHGCISLSAAAGLRLRAAEYFPNAAISGVPTMRHAINVRRYSCSVAEVHLSVEDSLVATKRRETAKARLSRLMKPNPFRLVEREDYWRDSKIWAEAARAALNAENLDKPIRLAFKAFELDPLSPYDWRLLLHTLASVHFDVPKGKAGKPKAWSDSGRCQLLADYYQVPPAIPRIESRRCATR
jgi:hypothetical protein